VGLCWFPSNNLAKGRGALLVSKHLNILSRQSTIKISLQTPTTLGTALQKKSYSRASVILAAADP